MRQLEIAPKTRVRNLEVPSFFYGTAWKEDKTAELVLQALRAGYRAVDTANQRKHYFEAGAGDGIAKFMKESKANRGSLFLQTKFTYARGQDHRLPYDPEASLTKQVQQSIASSLGHLQTDYIDSYVLHGPATGMGLTDDDFEVWQTMEALVDAGKTRLIGISNVTYEQLATLLQKARVKPAFVQNRCFASSKWDKRIRELCAKHELRYQGFSLLTANMAHLHHPTIKSIMFRTKKSIPQIVFRFAMQQGMIPLTGTKDAQHMEEDLQIFDFELTGDETDSIENIAF